MPRPRLLFLIAIPLLAFMRPAYGEEAAREDAVALLKRCIEAQSVPGHISMEVATDIALKYPDSRPRKQRDEFLFRRDGDRLNVSGRYLYVDKWKEQSYKYNMVINDKISAWAQYKLGDEGPRSAIVARASRRDYFEKALISPSHGAPLDGYLAESGRRTIAENLLNAPDLHIGERGEVKGVPCEVVAGHTRYGKAALWIAPSKGYCGLKYTLERAGGDLWEQDKPISEQPPFKTQVSGKGWPVQRCLSVLDDVSVEEVAGRFIPVRGRYTESIYLKGGPTIVSEFVYRRSNITINPDFSGSDAFQVDLPKGAIVTNGDDPKSGVVYEWSGEDAVPAYDGYGGGPDQFVPTNRSPWTIFWLIVVNGVLLAILGLWIYSRKKRGRSDRGDWR